ncbi:MAG: helix-turn-helix domain-containing protein [Candidatus Brocadiia bacterium]
MPYPHVFIKLTDPERKRIKEELHRLAIASKLRERRRLQVIYFSDQSNTYQEIQELLKKVSYRSIKNWVSIYRKSGIDGLIKGAK